MKQKILLLLTSFFLIPIVVVVGVILVGTSIPVGTFNHEEQQRLEFMQPAQAKKATRRRPAKVKNIGKKPTITEFISTTGRVRVNNLA